MYPSLADILKDLFGINANFLSFINSFGLMVACAFGMAAWLLHKELFRKEKEGLLGFTNEIVIHGKPASFVEMFGNFLVGFLFGFKILGVMISRPENFSAQEYIFSKNGNWIFGLLLGLILVFLKWHEKNKTKLVVPEERTVRIWPKDRVGDFVVLALVGGILGAKIFDVLENIPELLKQENKTAYLLDRLISPYGLTFFGGLIVAGTLIIWYAHKKQITVKHLADAVAPGLLLAYAIGRIGCQLSGDGDWGIYNSAYFSATPAKVELATNAQFEANKKENLSYLIDNFEPRLSADAVSKIYNDSVAQANFLTNIPSASFKGPTFMPKWMFAFTYPGNVGNQGKIIPERVSEKEHNRALPIPVFPTPFYETVMCSLLFFVLWGLRKKIKTPWVMFGLYLSFVGLERFLIEKIRVNSHYFVGGIKFTQAELISVILFLAGVAIILIAKSKDKTKELQ